jgi:hypothetical protein
MKSLLLAATVVAGILCTADTADAQFRSRRAGSYSYPTYSYPTYSYATPSYYNGAVVTSSYTPLASSEVVVTSGYTPSTIVYPSGSYYAPSYSPGSVYNPVWDSNSYPAYYGTGYPSGVNLTPSGVNWGGRRVWRW